MPDNKKLVEAVTSILSKHIGEYGANLYSKFYEGKEADEIIKSAENLLSDIVGPKNTAKQLKDIYKQFNNK